MDNLNMHIHSSRSLKMKMAQGFCRCALLIIMLLALMGLTSQSAPSAHAATSWQWSISANGYSGILSMTHKHGDILYKTSGGYYGTAFSNPILVHLRWINNLNFEVFFLRAVTTDLSYFQLYNGVANLGASTPTMSGRFAVYQRASNGFYVANTTTYPWSATQLSSGDLTDISAVNLGTRTITGNNYVSSITKTSDTFYKTGHMFNDSYLGLYHPTTTGFGGATYLRGASIDFSYFQIYRGTEALNGSAVGSFFEVRGPGSFYYTTTFSNASSNGPYSWSI